MANMSVLSALEQRELPAVNVHLVPQNVGTGIVA